MLNNFIIKIISENNFNCVANSHCISHDYWSRICHM